MHSRLFPQSKFYLYKQFDNFYRYDFFSVYLMPRGMFQVQFIIRGSPSNRRGRSNHYIRNNMLNIARTAQLVTT